MIRSGNWVEAFQPDRSVSGSGKGEKTVDVSDFQGASSPDHPPIDWFDITLETPAANLALDEVLLQSIDANPTRGILRTWSPQQYFVVVGRSNQLATEVNEPECQAQGVPVFRRASGGGAVAVGPGCLAYTLVLPLTDDMRKQGAVFVTQLVMNTIAIRLSDLLPGITVRGTSDLVHGDRKFSGNSQRWLRHAFLHHGTILYDFDLVRIGQLLRPPSRQPDYRHQRSHDDFVTNIAVEKSSLINQLVAAWDAQPATCDRELLTQARSLGESRYESMEWIRDR